MTLKDEKFMANASLLTYNIKILLLHRMWKFEKLGHLYAIFLRGLSYKQIMDKESPSTMQLV
jgi:hypothetical protein